MLDLLVTAWLSLTLVLAVLLVVVMAVQRSVRTARSAARAVRRLDVPELSHAEPVTARG